MLAGEPLEPKQRSRGQRLLQNVVMLTVLLAPSLLLLFHEGSIHSPVHLTRTASGRSAATAAGASRQREQRPPQEDLLPRAASAGGSYNNAAQSDAGADEEAEAAAVAVAVAAGSEWDADAATARAMEEEEEQQQRADAAETEAPEMEDAEVAAAKDGDAEAAAAATAGMAPTDGGEEGALDRQSHETLAAEERQSAEEEEAEVEEAAADSATKVAFSGGNRQQEPSELKEDHKATAAATAQLEAAATLAAAAQLEAAAKATAEQLEAAAKAARPAAGGATKLKPDAEDQQQAAADEGAAVAAGADKVTGSGGKLTAVSTVGAAAAAAAAAADTGSGGGAGEALQTKKQQRQQQQEAAAAVEGGEDGGEEKEEATTAVEEGEGGEKDDEGEEDAAVAAKGEDSGVDTEKDVGEDDYLDEDNEDKARADPAAAARAAAATVQFPWQNTSLSFDERAEALLARLTPQQKIDQLQTRPGNGIKALGVPAFNWQEECLHGVKVGQPGITQPFGATIYPINIAWAATFDDELAQRAAGQVGDEMRAHYNRRVREGWAVQSFTNCFGPHVHIVRDPRWGRLAETFGEDPLLQSNMAVAHVSGLQGGSDQGAYLKAAATCKHFIGNDLEGWRGVTRHNFDATISAADMRDTFMPAFEACVREARASSFMCSYNRVNGVPSCVNKQLLTDVLRGELGFDGFVVTDCTALTRMVKPPPDGPFVEGGNSRRASAKALQAGTDVACHVFNRLAADDVGKEELDAAARRVLRSRVRQGHFNLVRDLAFPEVDNSRIGHASHKATAREIAAKGAVLLKNEAELLPLNRKKLTRVAVLGPFANQPDYILGKYFGATVESIVTPLQALQAALPEARVTYSDLTALVFTKEGIQQDAAACEAADVCILFLGSRMSASQKMWRELKFAKRAYDTLVEGEGHDRDTLKLQMYQEKMWQTLANLTTKPLVAVLVHGGPIDVSTMHASPRVGAILSAWFPGQHGSVAIADLLLGAVAPSGRTPVTWYKDSYTKKLPMTDSRMRASGKYPGRTYRYWQGEEPLYPFGYGLSYVRWKLSAPIIRTHEAATAAAAAATGASARATAGAPVRAGLHSSSTPVAVATANITVQHEANRTSWQGGAAETAVLLFMRYVGPLGSTGVAKGRRSSEAPAMADVPRAEVPSSGCSPQAKDSPLVHRLVGYRRSGAVLPGSTVNLSVQLLLGGGSRSSWAGFGGDDPRPPCGAYFLRFGQDQPESLLVLLK